MNTTMKNKPLKPAQLLALHKAAQVVKAQVKARNKQLGFLAAKKASGKGSDQGYRLAA